MQEVKDKILGLLLKLKAENEEEKAELIEELKARENFDVPFLEKLKSFFNRVISDYEEEMQEKIDALQDEMDKSIKDWESEFFEAEKLAKEIIKKDLAEKDQKQLEDVRKQLEVL